MSHVVEIACEKPLPNPVRQADAQVALDLVADSVLFFSNPTTSLVSVNRAACRHLGYSRQQLCRMSLADIAPRTTRGSLADRIDRVMRGRLQEAHLKTVYRHQNGTLLPVQCLIRALEKRPTSLLVAIARDSGES